jgi:hypothetical protein
MKRPKVKLRKKKGVLDGTILWKFVCLDTETQLEITSAMGTTVEMVLDNLAEVERLTSFF